MQLITTHKNTDFDALASLVCATLLFPEAVGVLPRQVNPNVRAFMSIHKEIIPLQQPDQVDYEYVDQLVVVDTNSWKRLDNTIVKRLKDRVAVTLWDHHDPDGDMDPVWACSEKMGATVTLILRAVRERDISLSPIQATLCLAGLYEDTGNLTFPSTQSEDAHAAGYLLACGADLALLETLVTPAYNEKQKNVLFAMLSSAQRTPVKGYKVSVNRIQIEGHVNNLSVVVNMYREVLNVDAAFGIFHEADSRKCIVIGRSRVSALDIGSVMRSMGGGGHPGAGSALLKEVAPSAVESWIWELVQGNQASSVRISDLMSFPVVSVDADASMTEVAQMLRKTGCSGLPVVRDENLVGVISRRDFRKIKKESQLVAPVRAYMSDRVQTIDSESSPLQAARIMVKHDIGRLPVVDGGRLIGIVTRSDCMRYFYDLLPD